MEYSDVATAAQALQADGIKPTVLLVRERIGRGSLRDIGPHFRRWKTETATTVTTTDLPDGLAAAIGAALATARAEAVKSLRSELDSVERELAEMENRAATAEDERDQALGLAEQERTEKQIALGQLAILREAAERSEKQAQELAALRHQAAGAEELKKELAALRAERDALLARAVRAEAIAETLTSKTPDEKYTMAELLAESDYSQPQPTDEREWVDAPTVGRELI